MTTKEKRSNMIAFGMAILSPILVLIISSFLNKPVQNNQDIKQVQSDVRINTSQIDNNTEKIRELHDQIEYFQRNMATKDDVKRSEENIKELIRSFNRNEPQ